MDTRSNIPSRITETRISGHAVFKRLLWTQQWHTTVINIFISSGLDSLDSFKILGRRFIGLKNQTPWPESASELHRPSDSRLSAKSVPTSADKGCHVVSASDPYRRILAFLDRSQSRWGQEFSLLHAVQNRSEAQAFYCTNVIGGSFPEFKAAGAWS
jgi:hypothetical protein